MVNPTTLRGMTPTYGQVQELAICLAEIRNESISVELDGIQNYLERRRSGSPMPRNRSERFVQLAVDFLARAKLEKLRS